MSSPDNLGVREAIVVHKRSQSSSDGGFLRRRDQAGWIRRVAILRLVLNANSERSDAFCLEALKAFEEIVGVYAVFNVPVS